MTFNDNPPVRAVMINETSVNTNTIYTVPAGRYAMLYLTNIVMTSGTLRVDGQPLATGTDNISRVGTALATGLNEAANGIRQGIPMRAGATLDTFGVPSNATVKGYVLEWNIPS